MERYVDQHSHATKILETPSRKLASSWVEVEHTKLGQQHGTLRFIAKAIYTRMTPTAKL